MPLRADTDLPYGNACDLSVDTDGPLPVVRFAADPHGGPECLWFCLRVWRDAGGQEARPFTLVLKHFGNLLGGDDPAAVHPVARYDGGDWRRLPAGTAERLPDGRVEASWILDQPSTCVEIALCYPYGRPELDALLADTGGYWRADTIGVSQGGRPLVRLSNGAGAPDGDRPGFFFLARQHSGETPGSWVLDGLLRRLADHGDAAPLVWAVPLANIDGVEGGDYGKDNYPMDLNRAWGTPALRHEILVIQRDIHRWAARCRPEFALDLHAPGACETQGAYAFIPARTRSFERQQHLAAWARRLGEALGEDAVPGFGRVATYASRWSTPTFTLFFQETLQVSALTMETPYSRIGEKVLTREDYRRMGAAIADAVARG